MTATAWDSAAATTVEDNALETFVAGFACIFKRLPPGAYRSPIRRWPKGCCCHPRTPFIKSRRHWSRSWSRTRRPTAPSSRPWSSARRAAACRRRASSTARLDSDVSPAMQRDRTQGYFMRSSSTRRSPCGRRLATPAKVNKDLWPLIRRRRWNKADCSSCPAAPSPVLGAKRAGRSFCPAFRSGIFRRRDVANAALYLTSGVCILRWTAAAASKRRSRKTVLLLATGVSRSRTATVSPMR